MWYSSSFDNFIGLYKYPLWSQYRHRILFAFVCGIVFYDIDRLKTNKYHDQNLIRVARSWNFPLGKLKISAPAVYRLMDTGKYSNFRAVRRGSYKQFIKRKINRSEVRARSRSSRTLLLARWKTRCRCQKEERVKGRGAIYFPIDDAAQRSICATWIRVMWYTGDEEHWSPLGRLVQLIARSRGRGAPEYVEWLTTYPLPRSARCNEATRNFRKLALPETGS